MSDTTLASGTYEILRGRLRQAASELRRRFDLLNRDRAACFGNVETRLQSTAHVTTEHNCIPRDLFAFGNYLLLGFNVQFGLKTDIDPRDVLGLFSYDGEHARGESIDLILEDRFVRDFAELYRYYRGTKFSRFYQRGVFLYMVFQVGKTASDIKAFKWSIDDCRLKYIDNRSESEVRFPPPQSFDWIRSSRDMHRKGKHPHISIEDRVFAECVGGDLTIKVEDNTDDGLGIYREPVENADQTLDDAEIFYASYGDLVLLKMRPYQERDFRYLVFSSKKSKVWRIDSIGESCLLLPDDQGVIFPRGFCLQTGDCKLFDHGLQHLVFEKSIAAPNGEDHLYLYYQPEAGTYLQLRYNIIRREADTPWLCHGQAFLTDGRMLSLRVHDQPQRHHALQVWQTPFCSPNHVVTVKSDSPLYKIGNRELVRGLAECQELLQIIDKDESYVDLYTDLVKRATDLIDSYYWLSDAEAHCLSEPVGQIRDASEAAVDEYEKVVRVQRETVHAISTCARESDDLIKAIDRSRLTSIDEFVEKLSQLRSRRGEAHQLRERRYVDSAAVDGIEAALAIAAENLSHRCVLHLLDPKSLDFYRKRLDEVCDRARAIETSATGKEVYSEFEAIQRSLELLIETISQLKIEDLNQRSTIVDTIGEVLARLNRERSLCRQTLQQITSRELEVDFASQVKLLDQATNGAIELANSPEEVDAAFTRMILQLEDLETRYSESEKLTWLLAEKRQAICNLFESRREILLEQRTRRANGLVQAADRILSGVKARSEKFQSAKELAAYFVSDPMVHRIRSITEELRTMGETVRMEDVQSRLKAIQDDASRLQRDRNDLIADGANVIQFGRHRFAVNKQPIELTMVVRDDQWNFHITGTQFYSIVNDARLDEARDLWGQLIVSETANVYRAEYLAYQLFEQLQGAHAITSEDFSAWPTDKQLDWVRDFSQVRIREGYARGVHDHDALAILRQLVASQRSLGGLAFDPSVRSRVWFSWHFKVLPAQRKRAEEAIRSLVEIEQIFPKRKASLAVRDDLRWILQRSSRASNRDAKLVEEIRSKQITATKSQGIRHEFSFDLDGGTDFLLSQLRNRVESGEGDSWNWSAEAVHAAKSVWMQLGHGAQNAAASMLREALTSPRRMWKLACELVRSFHAAHSLEATEGIVEEIACLLIYFATRTTDLQALVPAGNAISSASAKVMIEGLAGDHERIKGGKFELDYHDFFRRLSDHRQVIEPRFEKLTQTKQRLLDSYRKQLKLEELRSRVLTTFVRNRLIDEVYLPRIGDNLAKQIGATGDSKRSDRMGLLLLISPPGYGKTTLMEYIAARLGLVMIKINGPAIGHQVTSLDPSEAKNASARDEINRINLALELGDNVMLYIDDIQHCHPELLQKFIPLCDATRRIDGVWGGESKSYDLRGRRFAVVMAGNPYTETGHRFHIPDMLANRADVYNLGEIIGDSQEAFELSYLENCLTSNPALAPLVRASARDQRAVIAAAARGSIEGLELEANIGEDQLQEILSVIQKLFHVRNVVLKINRQYIASAAQADEFRTEPPFKLQGSYRNMNRIAEKVSAVMNQAELDRLIESSYEQDSQTLSSDSESNLLKFRELIGILSPTQAERWDEIKKAYRDRLRLKGLGDDDKSAQFLASLLDLRDSLDAIRKTVQAAGATVADTSSRAAMTPVEQRVLVQHSVPRVITDLVRSQFQLLYDGLRPVLEQSSRQASTNERLREAIEDCLKKYTTLQAEVIAAEEIKESN